VCRLARLADADVYHSCEPSFATYLAQRAMPGRRHIVTVRDPRTIADWRIEFHLPSASRLQVAMNFLFEHNPLVAAAVRRADAVFTAYKDAIPKVQRMYGLAHPPRFLPTPVRIPEFRRKDDRPVVCYVGRLDRRKRPDLLIPVARRFPQVEFLVAGSSRDKRWEARLLEELGSLPNVRVFGFVDQFRSPLHSEILGRSWILLNTARREGLPNSFIEAAAHGCAILSSNDPDGFASRFGEYVAEDDFAEGLQRLLADGRWKALGEAARSYVASIFSSERAIESHLESYKSALAGEPRETGGN
jgi:glycosyltransferase involved in cell wall biosynthesis